MNRSQPAIRINVDVTNPGQFFACCGLLELADRLWPGAEGWFEGRQFCIECAGSIQELLKELAFSEVHSSLTDEGLKRLGTLLSTEKATLTETELLEKQRLSDLWKCERLHLAKPFDLSVDWWWDERSGADGMKTWAAKQLVLEIARPLLRSVKTIFNNLPFEDILVQPAEVDGLPFYFDSDTNSQNTPRDTGFSAFVLRHVIKTGNSIKPLLELGAFLGIQRFRPAPVESEKAFRFSVWPMPLPAPVAAAAATGLLSLPSQHIYEFRMLYRSKYMKAFLPALPYRGD